MSNFELTLQFMYEQLPMYQRQGKSAFKKDLSNIIALCSKLDNPQNKFKSIHVAGTNGKGSVSHILASLLQEHNFKVGLYTSPHYKDFRERIKINGNLISKAYVIGFIERIKPLLKSIQPSFFEITVAMAFDYFARKKVDVAIIETGVGGRLDSTNIIHPLISVVTNISMDHVDMLGDTLEKIAFEKAGIIKSRIPVVIGKKTLETQAVFIEKATTENAPITFAEESDTVTDYKLQTYLNALPFPGPYQSENLRTALVAFNLLEKMKLLKSNEDQVIQALKNLKTNTYFIGRWEKLGESPLILADSAHNEDGLKISIGEIEKYTFDQLHFVLGFVNDKDLSKVLKLFPKNANYYFAKADIPRGLDAGELKEKAAMVDLLGEKYPSVKDALNAAISQAHKHDLIYVGGSIFVLAEILP